VAAPLLVYSEIICLPRLAVVVEHFISGGLIRENSRARFDAAVASTKVWANSKVVRIVAGLIAYLIVLVILLNLPQKVYLSWYQFNGRVPMSWASWWYGAVSLPVLLLILLLWIWRIICWSRLLFRISKLKLALIPAHPDRVGGLGFLDLTIFAFMPLALVLGLLVAGSIANQVVNKHISPLEFRAPIIALVIVVVIVFVGPLVMFGMSLRNEFRRGVLQYGSLAHAVGRQFERKWFSEKIETDALEAPDFSATTDLYSIVAYSENMRLLPFTWRSVVYLVAVALLPFVPVIFMTIPLSVIVDETAKLLF